MDCINQVADSLAKLGLIDAKAIGKTMEKTALKQAMPFIQGLKRSLDEGRTRHEVLSISLLFDEVAVLQAMMPGILQALPKCRAMEIVKVVPGEIPRHLPSVASGATPGEPRFEFENMDTYEA